jgi:hypothetical protein
MYCKYVYIYKIIIMIMIIIIRIRIIIRPDALCCPEIYRDVPGKFHDDDDD